MKQLRRRKPLSSKRRNRNSLGGESSLAAREKVKQIRRKEQLSSKRRNWNSLGGESSYAAREDIETA